MALSFGNMFSSLTLESASFMSGLDAARKSLGNTQKTFERIGGNLQKVGAVMTVGITAPFIAMANEAMEGALAQRQAMAQVTSALESMGPVAGRTAEQLSKAADALETRSMVDADVILTKVTANLLTFGNVAGSVFDRAQQAAIDMAQRLGQDPQAAAVLLGKALNDPIKGLSALTRVGVSFSKSQIETIKQMAATGRTAEAQGLILNEVERQFRGAAAAAADTDPYRQLNVAFGQVSDVLGEVALNVLPPFTKAIKSIADFFLALPESVQTGAIAVVGFGAALGPVLGAIGTFMQVSAPLIPRLFAVGAAGTAAGAGGAAAGIGLAPLAPILIPLAAAVAGVYLAWKNWDEIGPMLERVGAQAKIQTTAIDGYLKQITGGADALDRRLGIPTKDEAFASISRALVSTWNTVNQYDLARWAERFDAAFLRMHLSVVNAAQRLYAGVKTWLVEKLGGVMTSVTDKAKAVGDAFYQLYDRVVGHSYVPDMVDGIAAQMQRLDAVMVSPVTKATSKAASAFQKLQQDLQPLLDKLFPEVRELIELQKELATLDASLKGGALSQDQYDEARRRLVSGRYEPPAEPRITTVEPIVDVAAEVEKLGKSLPDLSKSARSSTAEVVASFADMAQGVGRSIGSFAESLRSKDWLGALQDVADIIGQLARSGVFGGQQGGVGVPPSWSMSWGGARASGGPVLPGRSYLVGERGPEILRMGGQGGSVVANDQMGGPMTIHVAVEEGALFRPVVRSEAGSISYQAVGGNNRTMALRQRQALA